MQDELQKMEEIRNRLGVSYEEARYALQQAGGDMATAGDCRAGSQTAGGGLLPPLRLRR